MNDHTPTPERVTLTGDEREALACVATGHEPDLCDCHDGYRDVGDRFCEYAQETFEAVKGILAAREQALRDQTAEPHAYAVEVLANANTAWAHWVLATDDDPVSTQDDAEYVRDGMLGEGYNPDHLRIIALTVVDGDAR